MENEKLKTVIVAGCGRCGSTLLMHMLHAGGMPVIVDNYVSYELDAKYYRSLGLLKERMLLKTGSAIKLLDFHRITFKDAEDFKVIYLRRNETQQAKSQLKLIKATNPGIPIKGSQPFKPIARQIKKDDAAALKKLKDQNYSFITIWFEDLINVKQTSVKNIATFLSDYNLLQKKMIEIIVDRSTDCAPDMNIELGYIRAENFRRENL
jgi:hypothetical protein